MLYTIENASGSKNLVTTQLKLKAERMPQVNDLFPLFFPPLFARPMNRTQKVPIHVTARELEILRPKKY